MEKNIKRKMTKVVGVLSRYRFYIQKLNRMGVNKFLTLTLLTLSVLAGCQNESFEVKLPSPAKAFSAGSAEAVLIQKTSLLDGSVDNIIDSASCVSVKLPVTVVVNGQELVITTHEDLKYIERIVDESDSDEDKIDIVFPITVVFADYTQLVLQNEEGLEALSEACVEGGADGDIECVDFAYPLSLTTYNQQTQLSKVVSVSNDQELYDFIVGISDNELVSFQFPVAMILFDGTVITVEDNSELEATIESLSGACDEDDDLDFEDDDVDDSDFIATLMNGSWKIESYVSGTNQTSDFSMFTFTFYPNGTIIADAGTYIMNGNWESYGDDGQLELVIDFSETYPLQKINEDWVIVEVSDSSVNLKVVEDGEIVKTLTLKKV